MEEGNRNGGADRNETLKKRIKDAARLADERVREARLEQKRVYAQTVRR